MDVHTTLCRGRYAKQTAPGTWKDWLPRGSKGSPNGIPGGPDGAAWPDDVVKPGIAAVQAWLDAPPKLQQCRGVDWTTPAL